MISPEIVSTIEIKYKKLKPNLNERVRRHWAASEAMALGYGGISFSLKMYKFEELFNYNS